MAKVTSKVTGTGTKKGLAVKLVVSKLDPRYRAKRGSVPVMEPKLQGKLQEIREKKAFPFASNPSGMTGFRGSETGETSGPGATAMPRNPRKGPEREGGRDP